MKLCIMMLIHEYSIQQKVLIEHLSKDFDVYVHIDKRTNIRVEDVTRNRVIAIKKYKCYWGHFNLVLATLSLLKYSNSCGGGYDRYCFISGNDIPLVSNQQLYSFFENNNFEYLTYERLPRNDWDEGGYSRVDFFHPADLSRGNHSKIERLINRLLHVVNNRILTPTMKKFHLVRRIKRLNYYGGSQWFDITGECATRILDFIKHNPGFLRKFKFTSCSDELFFQTIVLNFVNNVEVKNQSLRYIDWSSGPEFPRVLRMVDYDKLRESNALFARKIDIRVDNNFFYKLWDNIGVKTS